MAVLVPCLVAMAWVVRDSQIDGYVGLPVNTLGQIVGDLLLAVIAGPVAVGYHLAQHTRPHPIGDLPTRIASAKHRIQLLDATGCLLSWSNVPVRGTSRTERECTRDRIIGALREALERDVAIEILMPDPGIAQPRVLRALGFTAAAHRELSETARAELEALYDAVPHGRLDIRTSQRWPTLALVRCDARMWVTLPSDGMPGSSPLYLEFGARSHNARALAAHFNELYRSTGQLR
ncbi:MAG TPA: hypothetical protein VGZ32_02530 [Actinocrinis sp.]|uniref:hypothetical protein n=1 Tax=Actinocrinis sp. TaxID=1920516 RepID=UPI002DDD2A6E|nr:hypothetical protein [Actinocrinis sp.]HEV3169183.1 hypothetical protein [Actinocrinis sp.]